MTGTNMTNMGIECKHSWTRLMEICCLDKNMFDCDKYKVFFFMN